MLLQLRACATGGSDAEQVLTAPLKLLQNADGADLALLLLAAGALAAAPRGTWRTLPVLAFLWTAICLLVTFTSTGIAENHFLDLTVLALVTFLMLLERGVVPLRFGAVVLPLYTVVTVTRFSSEVVEALQSPRPAELLAMVGPPAEGPMFAENPWFALLAGERPVLADAFTFRVLALKDPELMQHLTRDLEKRRFRTVVLRWPADTVDGRGWYAGTHFGPGFVDALTRSYVRVARFRTKPRPYWTHDLWRPARAP
jgi:hypothetical protein